MYEDSKELSESGSHGVRFHFETRSPITGKEMGEIMGEAMVSQASSLTRGGLLIGHIKAVARTDIGFVKVSLIDLRLGPELDTNIDEKEVPPGMINFMAAISGHTDEEVTEAVESMVEKLSEDLVIVMEKTEKHVHSHKEGEEHG
jgi:hypothetical protein